jgi:hypothetical protein
VRNVMPCRGNNLPYAVKRPGLVNFEVIFHTRDDPARVRAPLRVMRARAAKL